MIERKFRAIGSEDSTMYFGQYVKCNSYQENAECIVDEENYFIEIDPDTIGQFTGLHDKTGKNEGYEFDIVRVRWTAELGICEMDFDEIGVIKYNIDSASFGVELVKPVDVTVCEDGVYREDWLPLLKCEEDMHYDWEVIGNIYQNPELLKINSNYNIK